MVDILTLVNYITVTVYGVALTFAFVNLPNDKRQWPQCSSVTVVLLLINFLVYKVSGTEFLVKVYPLVIHLPLLLVLLYAFRKTWSVSLLVIFTAYILCIPRKWFGSLANLVWTGSPEAYYGAQILVTPVLFYLAKRYLAPRLRQVEYEPAHVSKLLVIIPGVFYVGSYLLTVYSKGLYDNQAAVGGLGTIVVLFTIFTSVNLLNQLQAKQKNDLKETLFQVQRTQLQRQLNFLEQGKEQMTIYRHDMRHHFNIIDAYLQDNDLDAAHSYINNLQGSLDATKIVRYSQNNPLNLILSAWQTRAQDAGIKVSYKIRMDILQGLDETELFLLLDNALENAINGAKECSQGERMLSLRLENKADKLLIEIKNSCLPGVAFANGLPIGNKPGHGQGVHSIISLVKKHQGIYSFGCEEGIFTLRVRI